jgi:cytoskeletal protein RodZ
MGKTLPSQETETIAQQPPGRKLVGEWFWRFLAVVMLVATGWVLWIAYQINPPPLITAAAYEAAAKARAARSVQGVITTAPQPKEPAVAPSAAPQGDKPEAPAAEAQTQPPPEPREPPVNLDKLKLSDTIRAPVPEKPGGK